MPHRLLQIAAIELLSALAGLAMIWAPAPARAADGCAQVEVQNVRPEQGTLMVAAFLDAATFSKTPAVAMQLRAGAATTMSFQLCGLSGPSVALTLFQDLNGNGKLDTNAFGLPIEPWGASGTPKPMAAPTWETSNVALDGTTIVVKLSK